MSLCHNSLHGWQLSGEEDELYAFVIAVAAGQVPFAEVVDWMQLHMVVDDN
jgi:hypothetical protein